MVKMELTDDDDDDEEAPRPRGWWSGCARATFRGVLCAVICGACFPLAAYSGLLLLSTNSRQTALSSAPSKWPLLLQPPPSSPYLIPPNQRSPPLRPPLRPSITWERHLGLNCSGGGHGAFNVPQPGTISAFPRSDVPVSDVSSLDKCEETCADVLDYGCEAVLFDVAQGKCYHRRYVEKARCSSNAALDLYIRTDERPPSVATPLIIDTDMSFDVDDVGDCLPFSAASTSHNKA